MFGSFLVHYTVTGLNWNIRPATDITSLFWVFNLLSKIAAALLSKRLTVTFLFWMLLDSYLILQHSHTVHNITAFYCIVDIRSCDWFGFGKRDKLLYISRYGSHIKHQHHIFSCARVYLHRQGDDFASHRFFQNVSYTWFFLHFTYVLPHFVH